MRKHRSGHGQRYEVLINGTWFPAWRKSQRPRVGGYHISPFRNFGRIEEVREVGRTT